MIYFKMEKIGNSTHNKEKKTRSENLVFNTIPAAGVEPARPCGHWILSLILLVLNLRNIDFISFFSIIFFKT
jgi:hypothetical protein